MAATARGVRARVGSRESQERRHGDARLRTSGALMRWLAVRGPRGRGVAGQGGPRRGRPDGRRGGGWARGRGPGGGGGGGAGGAGGGAADGWAGKTPQKTTSAGLGVSHRAKIKNIKIPAVIR